MLHTHPGRCLLLIPRLLVGAFAAVALFGSLVSAQVLLQNPFSTSYQNWIDPIPGRNGQWRLSMHNPTIMETSDVVPGGSNPPAAENNGSYNPTLLIQDAFTSPSAYDLRARMYSSDDDGFGLVFGYQNPDNYFRAFLRWQSPGNLGGTPGVSVQKVVNGVATQISPMGTGLGNQLAPTVDQIANREPIDVRVAVNGQNYDVYVAGINNNMPLASGTDPDLVPGKIGIQSWAQRIGPAGTFGRLPHWGTEVETVSVMQGATSLYSGTFNTPVRWRPLVMTNSAGVSTLTSPEGEDIGNFGSDFRNGWVYQQTNGFEWATPSAPETDFIGPAVVVDEPGSATMSNYQMRVRLGARDNDGFGVLVRAQDDNNFYRINFASEAIGTTGQRAPRGMSVQKVRNGVWTELYRDDQNSPLFVYPNPGETTTLTPSTGLPMIDLSVSAVGNSLKIQVRDPDGNTINYPLITDNSNPILSGTVGLQSWGNVHTYFMPFGGQDAPLVTALSALPPDVDVVISRATGNILLTNNGSTPINIRGISLSSEGGLNPMTWIPVTGNYDVNGNASVDPNDPWMVLSNTATMLTEREGAGNGGTLAVGQSVNLGNAWVKSRIEDVAVDLELAAGGFAAAAVSYSGTPFHRSDLNTDGLVNAADWSLFYPNLLADISSLTLVGRALAGDLNNDGLVDVNDFGAFKADYDVANGAGAFQTLVASVPEPSTIALLLVGALGAFAIRRRRPNANLLLITGLCCCAFGAVDTAQAVPVDLTTFTVEAFPPASGFPVPNWVVTASTATHGVSNQDASVLYSPDSALNKRYIGRLTPGTDDDVVGFVLGFEPGDATIGSSADYLLIDWKGIDQDFDFNDADIFAIFHADTPGGLMPVGLALSRVSGSPTADELWQHDDLPANPTGAVMELARGATLGSTPYNRSNGSHLFDIRYTPTNVTVLVDGIEQFNVNGAFPDGRFGLYAAWQGPQPTFSDFEVVPVDLGLSATVDRSNGNITLRNTSGSPIEFDYYQIDSESNSLSTAGWNSLSDQNFQAVGPGAHQKWQEAGGSSISSLGEAFLAGASTLAGNATISIGNAYNNLVNGEDLALTFRLPSGLILPGAVDYIGTPPVGLPGDYNMSGTVDAADYVVWRKTDGSPAGYNTWRMNFGRTSGGGAALAAAASVPEPATSLALLLGAIGWGIAARRCRFTESGNPAV